MSAETERAQAITDGAATFGHYNVNTQGGIGRLLDAGWTSPAQRNEELTQTAAWQRDARRAFAEVEKIANTLLRTGVDELALEVGNQLRTALGERFLSEAAL